MTCDLCGRAPRNPTKRGRCPIHPRRHGAKRHKRGPKMAHRHQRVDEAATKRAHELGILLDADSFISRDGHVFLSRKRGDVDWPNRKLELFHECHGRCQITESHLCSGIAVHPHHKVKRSDGGCDCLHNLAGACWNGHLAMHPEKQLRNPKIGVEAQHG